MGDTNRPSRDREQQSRRGCGRRHSRSNSFLSHPVSSWELEVAGEELVFRVSQTLHQRSQPGRDPFCNAGHRAGSPKHSHVPRSCTSVDVLRLPVWDRPSASSSSSPHDYHSPFTNITLFTYSVDFFNYQVPKGIQKMSLQICPSGIVTVF